MKYEPDTGRGLDGDYDMAADHSQAIVCRSEGPRRPTRSMLERMVRVFAPLTLVLSITSSAPAVAQTGRLAIGSADVHMFRGDFEVNLSITQTRPDCGAPLHGETCLRYSLGRDGLPLYIGYGQIASDDVKVTGSTIKIKVDTSTYRGFQNTVGSGGAVNVTWKANPGSSPITAGNRTVQLSTAAVSGTVMGYPLAGPELNGAMLIYTGNASLAPPQ